MHPASVGHRHPRRRRWRSGFTLVELLVALVLFDCALLAMAGDAALLVRLHATANRRATAAAAAATRLARLRAQGCPDPVTGTASPAPGIHEHWAVRLMGSTARLLYDSVAYDARAPRAAFVLRAAVVC